MADWFAPRKFSFAFLLLLLSPAVGATLGGVESSVHADREALRGQSEKTIAKESYSIHEITLSGRVVHEYVLPSGKVFAVSWRGISQPDLSVLLGSYYDEYQDAAAKQKVRRRGGQLVRTRNVVVEKSGHMRDVRGVAYLPKLLPAGTSAGDLQ